MLKKQTPPVMVLGWFLHIAAHGVGSAMGGSFYFRLSNLGLIYVIKFITVIV